MLVIWVALCNISGQSSFQALTRTASQKVIQLTFTRVSISGNYDRGYSCFHLKSDPATGASEQGRATVLSALAVPSEHRGLQGSVLWLSGVAAWPVA